MGKNFNITISLSVDFTVDNLIINKAIDPLEVRWKNRLVAC